MEKRIEVTRASIARLLNEYVVAITAGKEAGVQVGDYAVVYREFDVRDPSSGEALGTARLTVVRLRITGVEERFSLARTYESARRPAAPWATAFSVTALAERERIKVTDNPQEVRAESVVLVTPGDACVLTRTVTVPDEDEHQERAETG